MLYGPNWTEGLPSKSIRRPESAAGPQYVWYFRNTGGKFCSHNFVSLLLKWSPFYSSVVLSTALNAVCKNHTSTNHNIWWMSIVSHGSELWSAHRYLSAHSKSRSLRNHRGRQGCRGRVGQPLIRGSMVWCMIHAVSMSITLNPELPLESELGSLMVTAPVFTTGDPIMHFESI